MKNEIANTVVHQTTTIHLEKLTNLWQKACDGPTELKFSYKENIVKPLKHRHIHFRTPFMTELWFQDVQGVVQAEYDWLTNKTNVRVFKRNNVPKI